EFQHLIHDDYFVWKADESFMNEGCSMFSEILCGYTEPWGDINSFFATPDNSLTVWGDQGGINILADYGQAFLWATYLVDVIDIDFLKNYLLMGSDGWLMIVDDVNPGMELLDYMLGPYGWDFESLYKAWTISNIVHTGYTTIDLDDPEVDPIRVYEVDDKWPEGITGTGFGETITILDNPTGYFELGAYGTDYILLTKLKWHWFSRLSFDGIDEVALPMWVQQDMDDDGDDEWYTGAVADEGDVSIVAEVDLGSETDPALLTFDTYYDIEYGWDCGFVQVSDDGGKTWTSLENAQTSYDANQYPAILANLPGLTGNSTMEIAMEFEIPIEFLVDDLLIRFRYMTDWGFQEFGWWVDDVAVNSDPITVFGPAYEEVDFFVHVIRVDYCKNKPYYSLIYEMELDDDTEEGSMSLFMHTFKGFGRRRRNNKSPDVLLLVSADKHLTDYEFSVTKEFKWRQCMSV
ncbi:MAG: hypothetical protein ACW97V_04360, partial [Promethearchaeota archaeon]